VEQLHENLRAAEIPPKLASEVMKRIDEAFGVRKEEEED